MRHAKLWQKLLGVERAMIESVVFDEEAGVIVASVRPRGLLAGAGFMGDAAGGRTGGRAAGGGGPWIWGRCRRTSRPRRLGCTAPSIGWSSPRCPGRAIGLAIAPCSRTSVQQRPHRKVPEPLVRLAEWFTSLHRPVPRRARPSFLGHSHPPAGALWTADPGQDHDGPKRCGQTRHVIPGRHVRLHDAVGRCFGAGFPRGFPRGGPGRARLGWRRLVPPGPSARRGADPAALVDARHRTPGSLHRQGGRGGLARADARGAGIKMCT